MAGRGALRVSTAAPRRIVGRSAASAAVTRGPAADASTVVLQLGRLHRSRTHNLHDDFLVSRLIVVMTGGRFKNETSLFHRGHLLRVVDVGFGPERHPPRAFNHGDVAILV